MSSSAPPLRNRTLIWLTLLVCLGAAAGFVAAQLVTDADLRKLLWTGSVTLIFGALLGGVVQLLFADFNRRRLARAEEAQFITNVLSDLKAVYDRVERARVLIAAHQSALTYGNEMRDLIAARVQLLNVLRALMNDSRRPWISEVHTHIYTMDRYLEGIVVEFQNEYKPIADCQRLYEARVAAQMKRFESAPESENVRPLNEPWQLLRRLPELNDLLSLDPEQPSDQSCYNSQFVKALDDASLKLRNALFRTLR